MVLDYEVTPFEVINNIVSKGDLFKYSQIKKGLYLKDKQLLYINSTNCRF